MPVCGHDAEALCQTEQQEGHITRCLSSLARLLILTFAIMVAPVAAQSPALTPDVLSKMLDLIARVGTDREVPADLANVVFPPPDRSGPPGSGPEINSANSQGV